MAEVSPAAVPAYSAQAFISPTKCYLKVGPTGTEVALPVKVVTHKRSGTAVSVKNHNTLGFPLSVPGGYTGTIEFNMPVTVGVYTIAVGQTYNMIFGYDTGAYTQQIRITEITDTIPDL